MGLFMLANDLTITNSSFIENNVTNSIMNLDGMSSLQPINQQINTTQPTNDHTSDPTTLPTNMPTTHPTIHPTTTNK